MSRFLDYSAMRGGDRALYPDHGATAFPSCAVRADNRADGDRFIAAGGSSGAIAPLPHQPHGPLGISHATHLGGGSRYTAQGFCASYSRYPLSQALEPVCGSVLHPGAASPAALHHAQGWGGGGVSLDRLQCTRAAYGHDPPGLAFSGRASPLLPLRVARLGSCGAPRSDWSPPTQPFDWMRVKRNPPKTGECANRDFSLPVY